MERHWIVVACLGMITLAGCTQDGATNDEGSQENRPSPVLTTLYLDVDQRALTTRAPETSIATYVDHRCPETAAGIPCHVESFTWNTTASVEAGNTVMGNIGLYSIPPVDIHVTARFFANSSFIGEGRGIAKAEDMPLNPLDFRVAMAQFEVTLVAGLPSDQLLVMELWLDGAVQPWIGQGPDPSLGSRIRLDATFPEREP